MLLNEIEPQFFSFAKKAAAFFKMSRSIRSRRFSARNRAISIRCVGHTGGYFDKAKIEAPWWYQLGMLQNLGHLWIGGMCDDYLLTGNRRALDVLRLAADRVASEGGRYSDHIPGVGWPLNLLMTAWETTGDQKYLAAAGRHWRMLRAHFDSERGWVVERAVTRWPHS